MIVQEDGNVSGLGLLCFSLREIYQMLITGDYMMDFMLLFFCLISIIYCCDIPAIKGFEIFINNHDSMFYGIGLSVISAYIFYIFQVLIPRFVRFKQVRSIGCAKLYDIENLMTEVFSLLQDDIDRPITEISKESVKSYLDKIDIFTKNSRCKIQNHKELSLFESIEDCDIKIISLVDEVLSNQYLETKHEKILFKLKISSFHSVVEQWKNNLPGEYEHYNSEENGMKGYIGVNHKAINSDLASTVDEYLNIYNKIKKIREKLYNRLI